MSEGAPPLHEDTLKFGLLMESAQAHQRLVDLQLEKLEAHTQGIDGVVRDEIRRTLVDELQALTAETQRAARALASMRRTAYRHTVVWNLAVAVACAAVPCAAAHWLLPSAADIAALRARRDSLTADVAQLERRGAGAAWGRCGTDGRLCVRVDRSSPVYGEHADFYVVKER